MCLTKYSYDKFDTDN